jgi:hypothetical protein
MARLNRTQLAFAKHMGLDSHHLFDASGLRTSEWKLQMKELGKLVAFGANPCSAEGHTMRTRAGHCAQCNPANLSYLRRMSLPGDVYVAWSKSTRMVKIGLATNAYTREKSLNKFKYAGVNDWEMKLIYECPNAGEIENKTHQILSKFALSGVTYNNGGVQRYCTEIFTCSLKTAMESLEVAAN